MTLGITAGDIVASMRHTEEEDGPEAMLYIAWRALHRAGETSSEFDAWLDELPAGDVAHLVVQVQAELMPQDGDGDPTGAS